MDPTQIEQDGNSTPKWPGQEIWENSWQMVILEKGNKKAYMELRNSSHCELGVYVIHMSRVHFFAQIVKDK